MLDFDTVIQFFKDIKTKNDFNTEKELSWGYFFIGIEMIKIQKLKEYMVTQNYKFVDIFEAELQNENDPEEYYIHFEKVEKHNPLSLNHRNKELYEIAERFHVTYDGFDLGK